MRPWATVRRVSTSARPVWLKTTGPEVAFEAGLYELLVRVVPERVLTPLGVDVERGWVLLPDGGQSLGERLDASERVDALAAALPRYAQLQRDLAPHVEELLALGVRDMRPDAMPVRFEEALDAVRGRADVTRIEAMRDTVAAWSARLAESPVPPSSDHNDLHAWNILGAGNAVRFYDWGDAVVAHPFATMLGGLGRFPMEEPDVVRLRDAYLEPFGHSAPHARLVGGVGAGLPAGEDRPGAHLAQGGGSLGAGRGGGAMAVGPGGAAAVTARGHLARPHLRPGVFAAARVVSGGEEGCQEGDAGLRDGSADGLERVGRREPPPGGCHVPVPGRRGARSAGAGPGRGGQDVDLPAARGLRRHLGDRSRQVRDAQRGGVPEHAERPRRGGRSPRGDRIAVA